MGGFRLIRRAAACCVAAALLGGCGAAPASPAPVTAAAPAPPAGDRNGGSDRHGGGGGSGGTGARTGVAQAAWPSGVPLPPAETVQVSASPGAWMASLVLDSGLDAARSSVTELFRSAGYTLTSTAPGLVVLTSAPYTATITLAAADHSPARTQVVVHLAAV
jgi:hypothetical protein